MFSATGSQPTLVNCVLWDIGVELDEDAGSTTTITHSIVKGDWPGAGNIDADPMLDDLMPLPGSPCIDAGNNTAVPADAADLDGDEDTAERTPLDAAGGERFIDDACVVDTGIADPPLYPDVVDIGAFEFVRGDVDGNGTLDSSDVAVFVDVLLGIDTDGAHIARADLNCDSAADGRDVQALISLLID